MSGSQGKAAQTLDQLRLWHRFHVRLTALYGGAVLLTLVLMGLLTYHFGSRGAVESLQQRLLAVAASLAETIDAAALAAVPLESTVETPLHAELRARFQRIAAADPEIDSIYVLRPTAEPTKMRFLVDFVRDGQSANPGDLFSATELPVLFRGFDRPVVEDRPYADEFGLSLSGYAPVRTAGGHTVALVGVDVAVGQISKLKERVLVSTGLLFGVATVLVALASLLVARSVRDPLSLMIGATSAIAAGDFSARVGLRRQDEFGLLGRHFDEMAEDLRERQFIRDTFGRYVSEDVARALLEDGKTPALGGEERFVTILFADLRNYTTIAEELSATQMVSMLNTYLGAVNAVIDAHRGCVIEFLGDAVLAVFGAPQSYPDHPEKAVACALAMRAALDDLNAEWERSGLAQAWQRAGVARIEVRIGIHTGPVVAGNLGSPTRMKYAVIGDSVNVAARLETLNKELKTSILLSEDVKTRLNPALAARLSSHGSHAVKGRQKAVQVFSI